MMIDYDYDDDYMNYDYNRGRRDERREQEEAFNGAMGIIFIAFLLGSLLIGIFISIDPAGW
jgi:hypothetical protein